MAYLNTQSKTPSDASYISAADNSDRVVAFSSCTSPCNSHHLSVGCLLKITQTGADASLSARVNYVFSEAVPATATDALNYANEINQSLQHSKVFVVKDIDGNGQHYLRMDSVLQTQPTRQNLSHFLDRITQDISILVNYFTSLRTHTQS